MEIEQRHGRFSGQATSVERESPPEQQEAFPATPGSLAALPIPDAELARLLAEDMPYGDLTTTMLGLPACPARITFSARGSMRLAAAEEGCRLLELAGARCRLLRPSGSDLQPGDAILWAEGSAAAVLGAWKVAQTLVECASGIATAAARIVDALARHGYAIPVACTRKNFPGTKAIAVRAVYAGGAVMHRLGLSDSLLVFPEHLALLAPDHHAGALRALRRRCPERKLVAEASSVDAAIALASAGVDVLQLEKFAPAAFAECRARLAQLGQLPLLAAAGGVNADNAADYAHAGADLLVTSAPLQAAPAEVQVRIGPL